MPNKRGDLSADELTQLSKLLGEKGLTNACPVCKKSGLRMNPSLAMLRLLHHLDRGYPFVVVCCQNCGHTLLFNAKVLSLIDDPEGELQDEDTPAE